ncbi:MAG: ABC transporter substrate-binding protein [Acidimicrobiia bacterium]|nr:ABC transporter substrate-binding protein [Acidimicrobiia bacterium]
MKLRNLLALLAALALIAAACGDDDADEATDEGGTTTEATDQDGTTTEAADEGGTTTETGGESVGGVDIDAALAADLTNCEEAPSGDPIVVGMAMDFGEVSGFADVPGSDATKHLADLINCAGGVNGQPIDVMVSDIQGDPEVTSRVAQELLDSGAHFLIGPPFADIGEPVLQVTEGQVPVFFAASTEPNLPDLDINSFLVTFDDTAQATAAAEYALAQGFTRAITFSSPGPYFGYNPEVFTEVFTEGGGEVITDQNYVPIDDTDFSAQVNEIAGLADGSEVVYSAMLAFQLTALRGQLEGQGLDGLTYMSTDAFEATGGLFEDNIDGIIHTTHAFAEPGGRIEQLLQSYEATTGEVLESGTFAGLYADSMLLGIQGILNCGCTEPADIGAAVAALTEFEGFTGPMSYAGTTGVPDKPVSIHQVVDGADTLVTS